MIMNEPHFNTKVERDRYHRKARKTYCQHTRITRINSELVECVDCGSYKSSPLKPNRA